MNTLAQQQQALLAQLFDGPLQSAHQKIAAYIDSTWARGQKVYQANGHALACSALGAAYPVLAQLLGQESFDALAHALWHHTPPQCGDAAQWGGTLAAFISASTQLSDVPYLADVARLEWALHHCASAADASPDPASFALLAEHDPAQLLLSLAPGCASLRSAWPVVSIVHAHSHLGPTLDEVGRLLRAGMGEDALVWRTGFRPTVRCAQPGETAFVTAVLAGQTLGQVLDSMPNFDVAAWLPMAVQTGLLLGVSGGSHDGAA